MFGFGENEKKKRESKEQKKKNLRKGFAPAARRVAVISSAAPKPPYPLVIEAIFGLVWFGFFFCLGLNKKK